MLTRTAVSSSRLTVCSSWALVPARWTHLSTRRLPADPAKMKKLDAAIPIGRMAQPTRSAVWWHSSPVTARPILAATTVFADAAS